MTLTSRSIVPSLLVILIGFYTATAHANTLSDDFTGGLNLPWQFVDDLGDSPPEFMSIIVDDDDQDVKLIGSAIDYEENFDLSQSTTGYVGLGDRDYFYEDEVHVTATFSLLENMTLGFDEAELSNNDVYVVARGEGLTGYIFALDPQIAAADLVRVDDGAVVALGDDAILRDIAGIEQDGTYTLRLSAVDDTLTGQVYDESMNLLGEVTVVEDTYDSGWTGFGAAINDEGDENQRTLIAASIDNFLASDSLNIAPPDIDELTAAINAGSTDRRFDIDQNGTVESDDRVAWVMTIGNTYFGDANLDGEFNSGDLVAVFTKGHYEDALANNSLWADGDWNGDTEFDSGDFVLAFAGGGYEQGPRQEAQAVPEPNSFIALVLGLLGTARCRRRARRRLVY